jgi:hypothetical protein
MFKFVSSANYFSHRDVYPLSPLGLCAGVLSTTERIAGAQLEDFTPGTFTLLSDTTEKQWGEREAAPERAVAMRKPLASPDGAAGGNGIC